MTPEELAMFQKGLEAAKEYADGIVKPSISQLGGILGSRSRLLIGNPIHCTAEQLGTYFRFEHSSLGQRGFPSLSLRRTTYRDPGRHLAAEEGFPVLVVA